MTVDHLHTSPPKVDSTNSPNGVNRACGPTKEDSQSFCTSFSFRFFTDICVFLRLPFACQSLEARGEGDVEDKEIANEVGWRLGAQPPRVIRPFECVQWESGSAVALVRA